MILFKTYTFGLLIIDLNYWIVPFNYFIWLKNLQQQYNEYNVKNDARPTPLRF
jgi:hypothetical protein